MGYNSGIPIAFRIYKKVNTMGGCSNGEIREENFIRMEAFQCKGAEKAQSEVNLSMSQAT